jgi:hypothetical protein
MLYSITSLLIAADRHDTACDNMEQYAQKYAHIAHIPSLRDRLTYDTGKLFIKVGEKMTEASLNRMHLNGKMA